MAPETPCGGSIGGMRVQPGAHLRRRGTDLEAPVTGHPAVVDNELRVPDLQPTVDTSSFLLQIKLAMDGNRVRDQARDALRLDLATRLAPVRARLSTELAVAAGAACMRSEVSRIEVTGVHTHGGYLRVYVAATAQAGIYLPCPPAR